jgi:hypothetical protein
MTASKKTSNTKAKSNSKTLSVSEEKFGTPKGFWLYLALGILAAYSLYLIVAGIASSGLPSILANLPSLMYAGTSSFFIVVFSTLFLLFATWKRSAPLLAKVCAYSLVTLAALALIITLALDGSHTSSTTDSFYFVFTVVFHNPYVTTFMSIAAITGIVALLVALLTKPTPAKGR